MKIKSLKTGKYALHSALGPMIQVVEGEYIDFDLDEDQIDKLIGYGVIDSFIDYSDFSSLEEEKEEDEDEEEEIKSEIIVTLEKLIEDVEDESEKKEILQDWGEINVDKKVNKKKSVDNMILELSKLFDEE